MLCEGVILYLMVVKVFTQLPKKLWIFILLGYGKLLLRQRHVKSYMQFIYFTFLGIPLPFIIIGAAVRYNQYGSQKFGLVRLTGIRSKVCIPLLCTVHVYLFCIRCFLSPEYGTIWAFGAPVLAIIIVSLGYL